jgi:RNA polymerase sigma factor (sigma-70 family)
MIDKQKFIKASNKNLFILKERNTIIKLLYRKFPFANREDLEDVAQITLIKAYDYYDESKSKSLIPYLTTIAYNSYIDIYRKCYKKNEFSDNDFSQYENLFIDKDFSETFCDKDYQTELLKRLFSGLEDDNNIKTFILSNIMMKENKDIAIIQNITEANVRKRIQRARFLLQEKYQQIVSQDEMLV